MSTEPRELIARRVPECGWAVFDKRTGEKLLPSAPNGWFIRRAKAIGAKAERVGFMGSEWPADIVAFTQLPCDMVVRWTGLRPGFTDLATICRKQLREITLGASA